MQRALALLAAGLMLAGAQARAAEQAYDVVIYGGTSAAITAAAQAKAMGKTAIIVCPEKHLGGLTAGGLGFTDTGDKSVIGGLSRQFYHRVWQHYQTPEAWTWQKREEYGNKGQGTEAIDQGARTMWIFEPHAAEQIYEAWIKDAGVPVVRDQWLDREKGVKQEGGRIVAITMLDGKTYAGKMFIDATYEGDLMAAAKVSYTVGRESMKQYGEKWNGVQVGVLHHGHHFGAVKKPISAYWVPGDPSSGVLPRINTEPVGEYGAADKKIQAYCFRMCLTDKDENRVPFPKPEGYDPKQYELLVRIYEAGWNQTFGKFDPIPNHKTDTNNHGPFSTDNIGRNWDYPDASYERRREIVKEHENYEKGWFYFIANDPRVPEDVRTKMAKWGLAKDEFVDNGNWPHQLYVREARRMVGKYVMTENELLKRRPTPESIGMGSYGMDSHNVQRYITPEGNVQNEGDIGVGTDGPYQIAYGAITPKAGECANLLVPVCVSSSHIAYGSIRMEPVFMILGQSAATAAAMAIDDGVAVQDVKYEKLRARLLADGQVLEAPKGAAKPGKGARGVAAASLKGIVVDDGEANKTGAWEEGRSIGKFVNDGYSFVKPGAAAAKIEYVLPVKEAGTYEVRVSYPPNQNRSAEVKVEIAHAEGVTVKTVNQKEAPAVDGMFAALGTYRLEPGKPATVTIRAGGPAGYVIADAVQAEKK